MTTSRLRSSTSAALVALLLAVAAPARAEEPDIEGYREAVAGGADRFQDGDYPAARRQFALAYQIHPAPILLFNIASTYRREGDRGLALRFYRRFLAAADPADSRRALALKTVAELEAELSPPPPRPPPPRPVRAAPRPLPGPALEGEPERPTAGAALRWSGIAAGAAGLTAFALAWSAAREAGRAERTLEDLPADQPWDAPQERTYQDGRSARRRAILYAVAGGALSSAGVVLFVIGQRRARAASVSLAPDGGGGSLVLSGRF